jgi:hypothetical protein
MLAALHAVRRPKWEVEQWWVLPMPDSGTQFLTREQMAVERMKWVQLKREKKQQRRKGEGEVMVSLEVYIGNVLVTPQEFALNSLVQ